MKSKAIILFLLLAIILSLNCACCIESNKTSTTSTTPPPKKESAEEIYFKEISRISNAITNSTGTYIKACDDFLNLDIDLSEHKEATNNLVTNILVLNTAYGKLEPPEKYKQVHILFGTSMEHYRNSAGYLTKYIESNNLTDMNNYLEKAVSEAELAATYFNDANKEMKKIN